MKSVAIKVNRCHLPKQQVCCHEEVTLHEMKSLISLKTLACLVSTVLFLNNGDTITGPYDIVTIINNYFASIAETTKIYIYIYIYIHINIFQAIFPMKVLVHYFCNLLREKK